jgi:hypothetical protein
MMNFYGMKLRVRHPEGSIRNGISSSGEVWSQRMPHDYACIEGTLGVDKKPVDAIIGPYTKYSKVYVATMPPHFGGEDKVLVGFLSRNDARNAFLNCYAGDAKFLTSMSRMSASTLKKKLKTHRGRSISAMLYNGENLSWTALEILDHSSKYNDPGDKIMTPEDQRYFTELSRRSYGQPQVPYVSQGADQAQMNNDFYSMAAGGPGSGRHKEWSDHSKEFKDVAKKYRLSPSLAAPKTKDFYSQGGTIGLGEKLGHISVHGDGSWSHNFPGWSGRRGSLPKYGGSGSGASSLDLYLSTLKVKKENK